MRHIWVWIRQQDGIPQKSSLEMFSAATMLSEQVTAVVLDEKGCDWGNLGAYGAERVLVLQGTDSLYDSEAVVELLSQAFLAEKPELFLASADEMGREILPRLAARVQGRYEANVTKVISKDCDLVCTCPIYGGCILADIKISGDVPCFLTVRSGAFKVPEQTNRPAAPVTVYTMESEIRDRCVSIQEVVHEITELVALEDAEVIVAGGRGMGNAENFQLVQQLADILHGAVGATRPAIEEGWIPKTHQVGQSGKVVAPKLYIACGVSGATQHVSAILDSGLIVAVNKDPDAPIFQIADIGIVGDVQEILPLMIEQISRIRAT